VLQAEKYADFKVAYDEARKIEGRLAQAFLLTDSIQREAERVTATEIRLLAQDLEDTLGGVYSVLSQDLQMPLAKRQLTKLTKTRQIPPMPAGVEPTISTGFEALGRGHDLQKLNIFLQQLAPLGEQAIGTYLQVDEYIARVAIALGIDKNGLITPQEAVEQMQAQAQQQGMVQMLMEKLGPEAMKQMGPQFMEQFGMGQGANNG
jgi:hypothetical protein